MPETLTENDQAISLDQRREFLQLPMEERRRQLAAHAERMAEFYEGEAERTEREAWQGGDIVEP